MKIQTTAHASRRESWLKLRPNSKIKDARVKHDMCVFITFDWSARTDAIAAKPPIPSANSPAVKDIEAKRRQEKCSLMINKDAEPIYYAKGRGTA